MFDQDADAVGAQLVWGQRVEVFVGKQHLSDGVGEQARLPLASVQLVADGAAGSGQHGACFADAV